MTQQDRVLKYMQKNGSITSLEMFDKFYIVAPHGIIRDLRKKYTILDEWVTKTRKEYDGEGKEKKVTIKYKRYFLDKLAV